MPEQSTLFQKIIAAGLVSIGAVAGGGYIVTTNFAGEDNPMCVERNPETLECTQTSVTYNCLEWADDGACADKRTSSEICGEIIPAWEARKENMCGENPDQDIAELTPQEVATWAVFENMGCPPPSGEYSVAPIVATGVKSYCGDDAMLVRYRSLDKSDFGQAIEAVEILRYKMEEPLTIENFSSGTAVEQIENLLIPEE